MLIGSHSALFYWASVLPLVAFSVATGAEETCFTKF